MPISIQNRQRSVKLQTARIKGDLQRLVKHLGSEAQELSVVFANDALMQSLNATYRHQDRPTNVLAFPQQSTSPDDPHAFLLGDVIVSIPTGVVTLKPSISPVSVRSK